jgi:hypothetical protein
LGDHEVFGQLGWVDNPSLGILPKEGEVRVKVAS